jgi:hypothetical protein
MCTKPGHARIAVMLKSCSDSDRKAQERKGGRRGGRIPLGDFHGCMRQEPSRCGAGSKALRPSRRISPPVANVIMITGILITFGRNGRSLPPECATPGPNRSWCGFAGVSVDRPINLLGRRRDGLAVFPRDEIKAVAQQVDEAEPAPAPIRSLHHGLREHGGDRLGKAFEAVSDGDPHVRDAAMFQLVHDAQPEFGILLLFAPEAEDFPSSGGAHAAHDMHCLVAELRTSSSSRILTRSASKKING